MIRSFADQGTEDIFNGNNSKAARKVCPQELMGVAKRKMDMVDFATSLQDLKSPPSNKLEALKRDRAGQHSIRVNDQYRVCFIWTDGRAERVEIVDYH